MCKPRLKRSEVKSSNSNLIVYTRVVSTRKRGGCVGKSGGGGGGVQRERERDRANAREERAAVYLRRESQ